VLSSRVTDFTLVVGRRRFVVGWVQVCGADLKVMTWIGSAVESDANDGSQDRKIIDKSRIRREQL
jgi:hypothetical protein